MADNHQDVVQSSSQESLPLSQETFDFLWDQVQASQPDFSDVAVVDPSHTTDTAYIITDCLTEVVDPTHTTDSAYIMTGCLSEVTKVEPMDQEEFVIPKAEVTSSIVPYVPSSLPASQSWSGPYDFDISFQPQEKNTKTVTWTYSKLKDKLYVGKDCPCPINFSANISAADNIIIRAMVLYVSQEHASEVVRRCFNHSLDELNRKVFEAEHLVRCESNMAGYEQDPTTQRHSVTVPFEVPPVGQQYSTYIYKFACFGSCAGGPNRRPLMIVFSLEKDGQVVGRRKLDVKICACPGRDRKAEELQIMPTEEKVLNKKKKMTLDDTIEFTKSIFVPPKKKMKHSQDRHERPVLVIPAEDKEMYDFLVNMKKLYKMNKAVSSLSPEIKLALSAHMRNKNNQDSESN